ncbi:hypothetical protein CCP3SC15_30055 [Gammaproteobacteria bacterium]
MENNKSRWQKLLQEPEGGTTNVQRTIHPTDASTGIVGPLLTTVWYQFRPYNFLAPIDSE